MIERGRPGLVELPDQTVDFMMERLEAGDFYILCPDNDVPRSRDERRILWAAGDGFLSRVENRIQQGVEMRRINAGDNAPGEFALSPMQL